MVYKYFATTIFLVFFYHCHAFDDVTKATLRECQKKHEVSDQIKNNILTFKDVEADKNVKCMLDCWTKELKLFIDRKPNKQVIDDWIKHNYVNEDAQKKAHEGSDFCVETVKVEGDDCEWGYNMYKCYSDFARKNDLRVHEFHVKE